MSDNLKDGHYPWNSIAHRSLNTLVGCSRLDCSERKVCWARKAFILHRRCYPADASFDKPFDMFERWEEFRAKPGERIFLGGMGDLFDPQRLVTNRHQHLNHAGYNAEKYGCVFLLQSRQMGRVLFDINGIRVDYRRFFEVGTTFSSPADIKNVKALARLPDGVVRFIAFEPFTWRAYANWREEYSIVETAKPNWAYIGLQTPLRRYPKDHDLARRYGEQLRQHRCAAEHLARWLQSIGCKVIFKKSCGPELHARNEGVCLP